MQWVLLITMTILTTTGICLAADTNGTEGSISPPIDLNINLRRALLKAITDLENENTEKSGNNDIIEKASASALSIFTNTEVTTSQTTLTTAEPNITHRTTIVLQKSQAVQHSPITTIEKKEFDPFNDAEQILTSASDSFTLTNRISPNRRKEESKKLPIKPSKVETTTVQISTTSTEENEAKVEDVQFFSAPLVAAFTVHQDEQGVPKKVEPIYNNNLKKHERNINLREENKDVKEHQQKVVSQFDLQQLAQFPLRNNVQPFPRNDSLFVGNGLSNKSPPNAVSLPPNIAYHQLIAGQLPLNGQILPVKSAINFHTPIIQTASFQQFYSTHGRNPSLSFGQPQNNQVQFDLNNHQPKQFTWQDARATNPVYNNLNTIPSFSIQKSIQPPNLSENKPSTNDYNSILGPPRESNRFFRSNLESTKNYQPQGNRIFRSSVNSPFGYYDQTQRNPYHLSDLVLRSGAFKEKSPEDINIISKVLSLDYFDGVQFGSSTRTK